MVRHTVGKTPCDDGGTAPTAEVPKLVQIRPDAFQIAAFMGIESQSGAQRAAFQVPLDRRTLVTKIMENKHYTVVSPEMSEVVPMLEGGSGPTEYFRCYVIIEAANKQDAKTFALQTKDLAEWVDEARSDKRSPFTGLEVHDNICPHGVCQCPYCCDDEGLPTCPECLIQFNKEIEEQMAKDREFDRQERAKLLAK